MDSCNSKANLKLALCFKPYKYGYSVVLTLDLEMRKSIMHHKRKVVGKEFKVRFVVPEMAYTQNTITD